jgi:DNA-binding CsgD family transcriptional regulator
MYLSKSTVRNHLSVVYGKFGVHSQAELLAKLRNPAD